MRAKGEIQWRVWGPLVFASLLFVIASAIRLLSFSRVSFVLDIGSDFGLWATGILFSLAASEQTRLGGRTERVFRKKSTGTGIEIDYIAVAPDQLDVSPKYLYLFVYSMMIWILTILIGEQAHSMYEKAAGVNFAIIGMVFGQMSLAATTVAAALRALLEEP